MCCSSATLSCPSYVPPKSQLEQMPADLRERQAASSCRVFRLQVIDKSVRATRSFVRQYLAETIQRGQDSIAQYASRYTDTMIGALATCMQGESPPCKLPAAVDCTPPC